jgi:branched-chain amino acid aminotransferase
MPLYAYFQKKFMPLADAKINVMTNCIHYGGAIFEGIRGNWNPEKKQMYIFRIREHYQRMLDGSKVLMMDIPYSIDDLCQITVELAQRNNMQEDMYIRPLVYKSSEQLGVRLHGLDADFLVFAIPWGRYLDCDTAKVGVSSWRRSDDNAIPPQLKVAGIYVNNALAKTEAVMNGFDEAIMLTPDGHLSEGSGENIFLVENGKLVTPACYSSILGGITRSTVIELAKNELGLDVEERQVDRGELYTCQECFLTGTAAHLTPIAEVDHRKVANAGVGPITAKLQTLFFNAIKGNMPKYMKWCTPVFTQKGM